MCVACRLCLLKRVDQNRGGINITIRLTFDVYRRWSIRDWGDFLTNRRFAFGSSIPITICTRLHGLSLSQTFLFSVPLGEQPAMHPARPRLLSNSFAMPTGLCLTDFTFLPVWFCIFASL